MYPLYNSGSVSLDYSIDLSSVNKLEFPIFQCMKTKGTILPGETDQVQWIFRPLEAKNYEVDVPITVEDGLTRVITFKGQGIRNIIGTVKDAKQLDRPSPAVPIIKGRQSDLAQLSIERLNFGHVPLNASLCQIFVLRNTSDCATISYSWESPSFHNSICSVNIKPISGSLVPGRSQVCKVTVKVGLRPGFYDFDLVCKVSNATEFVCLRVLIVSRTLIRPQRKPLKVIPEIIDLCLVQEVKADLRPQERNTILPSINRYHLSQLPPSKAPRKSQLLILL